MKLKRTYDFVKCNNVKMQLVFTLKNIYIPVSFCT